MRRASLFCRPHADRVGVAIDRRRAPPPRSATRTMHHATCNVQRAPRITRRAIRTMQHATCNVHHAAYDVQEATCHMPHATCNMQERNMKWAFFTAAPGCPFRSTRRGTDSAGDPGPGADVTSGGPSPGADVHAAWRRCAQSRRAFPSPRRAFASRCVGVVPRVRAGLGSIGEVSTGVPLQHHA